VSPAEVESAILTHPAVLECAVVGCEDEMRLVKPYAFVVVKDGQAPSEELGAAIKTHVKTHLAVYKCPRWIAFVPELPKTATGKIQRYKLRQSVSVPVSAPGTPPIST
jgi:benzoate-CoA ligase